MNMQKNIYDSKNYLDMIFRAVNKNDRDLFVNKQQFILNKNTTADINVEIYSCEEIIDDINESQECNVIGAIDKNLYNSLQDCYNNLPNTATFTIKNTVTNILAEENDYENLNHAPHSLDIKDEIISKDYLKIGTAYHGVMQRLNFTESKQEIETIINNMVLNRELDDEVAQDIKLSEIYNAKENLKNLILDADAVYREKQFVMQENYNKLVKNSDNNTKVIVQGIIDLVVIKNQKAILIDYKTNRINNESDLISKYSLQLELYNIAFEKATGIVINQSYLYSFHLNKLIEVK
jgi:CRISPR/Cas system-associated exonuclease Cas4 (RecB family)